MTFNRVFPIGANLSGDCIGREAALLILRKWRDEGTLVCAMVDFDFGTARKVGRLFESEECWRLKSDADVPDGAEDFVFAFPSQTVFLYDEPGEDDLAALEIRSSLIALLDFERPESRLALCEIVVPPAQPEY